jgi:hypothetical protein
MATTVPAAAATPCAGMATRTTRPGSSATTRAVPIHRHAMVGMRVLLAARSRRVAMVTETRQPESNARPPGVPTRPRATAAVQANSPATRRGAAMATPMPQPARAATGETLIASAATVMVARSPLFFDVSLLYAVTTTPTRQPKNAIQEPGSIPARAMATAQARPVAKSPGAAMVTSTRRPEKRATQEEPGPIPARAMAAVQEVWPATTLDAAMGTSTRHQERNVTQEEPDPIPARAMAPAQARLAASPPSVAMDTSTRRQENNVKAAQTASLQNLVVRANVSDWSAPLIRATLDDRPQAHGIVIEVALVPAVCSVAANPLVAARSPSAASSGRDAIPVQEV